MTDETILITGGSGRLGKELVKLFKLLPADIKVIAPSSSEMNIVNKNDVNRYIFDKHPDMIIHTAAMTSVRECQDNWQHANRVNIDGTINIVNAAAEAGKKVIYISTACVFDGENGPYSEDSMPMPKNYYALTKLIGEKFVLQNPKNLVIRTNFVPYEPWPYPAAFTDRKGTYLFAHDVARGILAYGHETGIIHLCGIKEMSMYQLAKMTTPDVSTMDKWSYRGPPVTMDMRLITKRVMPMNMTRPDGEKI